MCVCQKLLEIHRNIESFLCSVALVHKNHAILHSRIVNPISFLPTIYRNVDRIFRLELEPFDRFFLFLHPTQFRKRLTHARRFEKRRLLLIGQILRSAQDPVTRPFSKCGIFHDFAILQHIVFLKHAPKARFLRAKRHIDDIERRQRTCGNHECQDEKRRTRRAAQESKHEQKDTVNRAEDRRIAQHRQAVRLDSLPDSDSLHRKDRQKEQKTPAQETLQQRIARIICKAEEKHAKG